MVPKGCNQRRHRLVTIGNPIRHRRRHPLHLLQHLHIRIQAIVSRFHLSDIHAEADGVVGVDADTAVGDRGDVFGEGFDPGGGEAGGGGVVDEDVGVDLEVEEEGFCEGFCDG